jgi:hypothetical protein
VATAQREQEVFIVVVVVARNTLDKCQAHERAATLAWEKEKFIAHHLEH